jgi:hypothetical protein
MESLSPSRAIRGGSIDRIAIALSGLCLVHCLATALVLGTLSSLGGMLGSHWIHEFGLGLAIILGVVALGRGVAAHGRVVPLSIGGLGLGMMAVALTLPHDGSEVIMTVGGVSLLALGHYLNRSAAVA